MHFDEDAGDSDGGRGPGQRFNELRLTAGPVPAAPGSWTLWVASKHDRIAGCGHDGQAAHIHDQIVVAEGGAALGQDDVVVSGAGNFLGGIGEVRAARRTGLS